MNNNRKVVVIGGNHHNTLGVIRSLGRKDVLPYVILTSGNQNSFVLKSKYIQNSWVVNGSDEALEFILQKFTSEKDKSILIPCHDVISSIIDQNMSKLIKNFVVTGTKEQGKVTFLMNKKNMGDLAARMGLNVPETVECNSNSVELLSKTIFPCITKPVDSKSGSKDEIVICKSENELSAFFAKHNKDYVVQHFIDKQFEFQLIGCSMEEGEDIIIPGVSKILRQTKSSNTGFLLYTNLDDSYKQTIDATKAFIREIGYSGLFSVEFLRDKSGKDYFMEMNYRNDGNTISVANAGVNLPYIWYLYCLGEDFHKEIKPIHEEYVMPEFAELELFKQRQISFKQMIRDMKMATSFMDYAEDDPSPTDGWKSYKKNRRRAVVIRMAKTIMNK